MACKTSAGCRLLAAAIALAAGVAGFVAPSAPVALAAGMSTWDGLRPEVFGTRRIDSGLGVVTLKAPFRPEDQRAVPVGIEARFIDGRTVKSVTLIVDENPSPVAAVFTLATEKNQVALKTNIRLNQETHVRAIVEASDGKLYMVSQLVRFAGGQAACAAPPTGNPEEIAANMGKMQVANVPVEANASSIASRVRLKISHPNHSGMALDQQSLLYIPLRMITNLEVSQGGNKLFDMAGSISLSENPAFEFDVDLTGEHRIVAKLKDSDGAEWSRELALPAGS
ncbi:MAG: quinoprotein dehydrogenase-associated SoxYZ-like carrier [Hyphomicrobiaceae bacterium]|nr:quinoprotein dehydrogenase-associated SoxYZ-like carrier [Hyphomicrobiaceae bacterium]